MKLRKVEIHKFKSIDSIEIEIDSLAMFIGENNAGKSNILRAIELFYQDSVKGINEEYFYFKKNNEPITIILTFDRLTEYDEKQKYLKHWIYDHAIRVKKVVEYNNQSEKYETTFYGWQAKPRELHFDLSRFDEYKGDIAKIVKDKNLPDYFKTDKGTVTQASYKEGVMKCIEDGKVEFGDPDWIKNPAGLKEVFADLLPKFYLVPAVKDACDESKTTQQTVLGKLVTDLTNRIVLKNPKFEEVKNQLEGLKKYLNKSGTGDDSDRLQEIKDFESTITGIISESMPGTKVGIEIVTPELVDLFKDVNITLDDALPTSIDSKGHGLQRALILAYIRAYAKTVSTVIVEEDQPEALVKNFILAIEEPELYLHPNGQRKMIEVLRNIATTDQILACTHSNFFVDMFEYKNIVIVGREEKGPTNTFQFVGDIFAAETTQENNRLKKVFRYLSLFDLSRSEMFFSKKVVLVEGDTEKFIVPFWATKFTVKDKKYDFVAKNICVVECGGKTNIHIFMRVLNKFKVPYVAIHDIDPINFPENKPNKTDKEESELRMFKENDFIDGSLDKNIGKIIKITPELENIIGIATNQVEKHGKIGAAFMKYEDLSLEDYPIQIQKILDLINTWSEAEAVVTIS
ncbi:MAG: AAA family ATPase [Candidatus Omnitrophica bacterium]|nr:AAA family ATPase [Candidatus Omnitrophota bacterium]